MATRSDAPSLDALISAAWLLKADVAAVRAVAEVESGKEGAFLVTGEPVILFERHVFHRLTGGRFDATRPDLSSQTPGGYGRVSQQHRRLQEAVDLDPSPAGRAAALQSASWGLFQLMGFNHAACGYPDLQRFITAMYRSADDHLRAFTMFLRHDGHLVDALREHRWADFARVYNGPGFKANKYDTKLAAAYARLVVTDPR